MMTIEAVLSNFKNNHGLTEEQAGKYLTRYTRLIQEFGVPENEAGKSIRIEIEKDLGILTETGERNPEFEFPVVLVKDLNLTEMYEADLCLKVISIRQHASGKIAISGVGCDASGRIKFAISNGTICPPLELEKTYNFYGAILSEFNQNVSLLLGRNSVIQERDDQIPVPEFKPVLIKDLQPGIHDLRARVIRVNTTHENAKYLTNLADESGSIFAAVWDKEGPDIPCLIEGETIQVRNAICSVREDESKLLDLSLAEVTRAIDPLLSVKTGNDYIFEITGVKAAEIIRRCPECRKILHREGTSILCETHGPQESPIEEPRVKIRLDDGKETLIGFIGPSGIKDITGYSPEDLQRMIAGSPLRENVLEPIFHEILFGRKGIVIGDRINDLILISAGHFLNPHEPPAPGQTKIEEVTT